MSARDRRFIAAMSAVLVTVAAGVAAAWYAKPLSIVLDAEFCSTTPAGAWLVLIDATDVPPPREQQRIVASLRSVAERMHRHERLALHVIGALPTQSASPVPLPGLANGFNRCKSADPRVINRAFENERKVRALYQHTFLEPLTAAATHLARGGKAGVSPILEAIDVAAWSPQFRSASARRIVLISDLEQNSDVVSFLGRSRPDACAVIASPLGRRLAKHEWSGVRIELHYIRTRERQQQNAEHLRFFVEFFHLLGVSQVLDGTTPIAKPAELCTAAATQKQRSTKTTARKN